MSVTENAKFSKKLVTVCENLVPWTEGQLLKREN